MEARAEQKTVFLLFRKLREEGHLSPGGRAAVSYDHATALQPGLQSKSLSQRKPNARRGGARL